MYDYGLFQFESKQDLFDKAIRFWNPDKTKFWQNAGIDLVIDRREGYFLYDMSGRRLIDLHLNGGTYNFGHRHPELVETLKGALDYFDIGNHWFPSVARAALAESLVKVSPGMKYAVFAPGGAEAVDIAIKSARYATKRRKIVSIIKGYHGHSGLAVATGDDRFTKIFLADQPDTFVQVPFNDIGAMEQALKGNDVAALIIETIPATYGFPMPKEGYLNACKALCEKHGAMYIADEVQTGLMRTGKMWGWQAYGVQPDIMVTAKGLSGGLYPISAALVNEKAGGWLNEDGAAHISTSGGAELGCIVGHKVIEMLLRPELVANVETVTDFMAESMREMIARHGDIFTGVRQKGVILGLEFSNHPEGAMYASRALYEHGVWAIFSSLDKRVLQWKPGVLLTRRIVDAVAAAGFAKAQHYAEWAVRETGMGVVEHKRIKNEACTRGLVELYGNEDFISPRIDPARKIVELPRPAGVIFALVPVTNPVATVLFKTLLALMTRNAIILSPHPQAKACCSDAARVLAEAARAAGAPDGAIQVIDEPNIPLLEKLMADERVDLIVATGGPSVVKAAYRSGNPAFGVGPGNAPVLVDDTADLKLAARRIVASKSFDNSILCTNESTVLAFTAIADRLLEALKAEKAHVCSPEETEKLRNLLFTPQGFNVAMIGKDASVIAREAGFNAPHAKILVTPVSLVQPEERLVREKLCPVLAFARVQTIDQAISAARSMMRASGKGHSAAIHSTSEAHIMAFAAAVPALRIAVNTGCSLGASGYETNLGPSMTIGTGFAGGSSIGDNLTPHHLMHFARIAYNKETAEAFGNFAGLDPLNLPKREAAPMSLAVDNSSDSELRKELRRIILEELKAVLAA